MTDSSFLDCLTEEKKLLAEGRRLRDLLVEKLYAEEEASPGPYRDSLLEEINRLKLLEKENEEQLEAVRKDIRYYIYELFRPV